MARKSVEVNSCLPGARSLAEAGDKPYSGRQGQVRVLAGCIPCNHDSCLAKGLPACTSLKEVCTTLRVWPSGLLGVAWQYRTTGSLFPGGWKRRVSGPLKFREEEAMASTLSWRKLQML